MYQTSIEEFYVLYNSIFTQPHAVGTFITPSHFKEEKVSTNACQDSGLWNLTPEPLLFIFNVLLWNILIVQKNRIV